MLIFSFIFATLLLILLFIISITNSKLFLTLYLVVYSGFLGSVENIIYDFITIQNCLLMLNFSALLGAIYLNNSAAKLYSEEKLLLQVYFILFLLGIYFGVTRGGGTLANSIVDGKEFFTCGFLYYCFVLKNKWSTCLFFYKLTLAFALYLSALMIVHLMTGLYLPGYGPVDPNDSSNIGNGIHIRYPLIIAIHSIIQVHKLIGDNFSCKRIVVVVILMLGVILQPRSSILISSLFVLFIILCKRKNTLSGIRVKLLFISILFVMSPILYVKMGEKISNTLEQTLQGGGPAFTRLLIGVNRIDEIAKKPILGSGFVHKDSTLGIEIEHKSTTVHNERLSTVDSGYMDLLVRFGVIGGGLLLFSFISYCKLSVNRNHNYFIFLFLFTYLLMSLTWSVLTYGFGIAFIGFSVLISRGLHKVYNENITASRT
jgi:hypothetical protein